METARNLNRRKKMNKYLIAEAQGGIMECPEIKFHNPEIIEAKTDKKALDIYNTKHRCTYFYGDVLAYKIGNTITIKNEDAVSVAWYNKLQEA